MVTEIAKAPAAQPSGRQGARTAGRVAIVGGGIMGRLLAYRLGERAVLFERRAESDRSGTSFAAGGMLAPYSEMETFDDQLLGLSQAALKLWQQLATNPDFTDLISFPGTIVVNHGGDNNLHRHLASKWQRFGCGEAFRTVTDAASLLPWQGHSLASSEGLFIPSEGVVDNGAMLDRLIVLARRNGADIRFGHNVTKISQQGLMVSGPDGEAYEANSWDAIIDARGIDATGELRGLRGVRGEAIVVKVRPEDDSIAPWQQKPTVRLLHPRYPIYLIPRPHNTYVVGASTIESADDGPISVRSLLELLSAAFSIHPALAEAQVVATRTGVRAAFDDNLPVISRCGQVLAVNGLYRHGFLLAPVLAEAVEQMLNDRPAGESAACRADSPACEIMANICREDSHDCTY